MLESTSFVHYLSHLIRTFPDQTVKYRCYQSKKAVYKVICIQLSPLSRLFIFIFFHDINAKVARHVSQILRQSFSGLGYHFAHVLCEEIVFSLILSLSLLVHLSKVLTHPPTILRIRCSAEIKN